MSETIIQYCYSFDGEWYRGHFGCIGEALHDAKVCADNDNFNDGEEITICIGVVKNPLETIDCEYLRGRIGEIIADQLDEWCWEEILADNRIIELTRDQQKELGGIIMEYMKANARTNYYGVGRVSYHPYIVGTDVFCDEIRAYVREQMGAAA